MPVTSVDAPRHRRASSPPPRRVQVGGGPDWEQTVEAFFRNRSYAESTRATGRYYLLHGRWILFMHEQKITNQADLTSDHISQFLDRMKRAGLKPNSLRQYRRLLRGVVTFCLTVPGYTTQATLEGIPKAARVKKGNIVDPWTREVEAAVVTAAGQGRAGRRDSLLVRHMLATGVRSSEVIASVLEDYLFASRPPTLKVKRSYWDPNLTKNSKDRETTWRQPYKGLPKELAAYVNEGRPQTWRQEMFLSGSAPDTPLSADAIKQIFQRISARLGYNVHAHQTRHTWAQRLADSGVSPYELMVPGGWSSLGQVDVYYTANKDAAIKAVADAVIT